MYSGGLTFSHSHQTHSDCVNGSTGYVLVQNLVDGLLPFYGIQSFEHITYNCYKVFAIAAVNGHLTIGKLYIKLGGNLTSVQSNTPTYFQLSNTASISSPF